MRVMDASCMAVWVTCLEGFLEDWSESCLGKYLGLRDDRATLYMAAARTGRVTMRYKPAPLRLHPSGTMALDAILRAMTWSPSGCSNCESHRGQITFEQSCPDPIYRCSFIAEAFYR